MKRRTRRFRGFRDAATPYVQIFTEPMRLANAGECVAAARSIIRKASLVPVESSKAAREAYEAASKHVLKKCPKSTFHIARSNIAAETLEIEAAAGLKPLRSTWGKEMQVKRLTSKSAEAIERARMTKLTKALQSRRERREKDYPEYTLRRKGKGARIPVYRKKSTGRTYKSEARASKIGRPRKKPKI